MMEFVNDSKVFSKRFEEIKSFIDVERKLPHNLFSNFKEKYFVPAFYITALCLIFCIGNFNANSFIYFQF